MENSTVLEIINIVPALDVHNENLCNIIITVVNVKPVAQVAFSLQVKLDAKLVKTTSGSAGITPVTPVIFCNFQLD